MTYNVAYNMPDCASYRNSWGGAITTKLHMKITR